ncbi:hypothetical protein DFJ73DRAFT_825861 [Zopfochytrium polystomum]|nr:hypothetical protein DFJ73DRAFT_825861 [Zopfochytrium polystomum]
MRIMQSCLLLWQVVTTKCVRVSTLYLLRAVPPLMHLYTPKQKQSHWPTHKTTSLRPTRRTRARPLRTHSRHPSNGLWASVPKLPPSGSLTATACAWMTTMYGVVETPSFRTFWSFAGWPFATKSSQKDGVGR